MAKLNLVEKFYSIQGEGWNAGKAAFFVRFAGCNLDCVFGPGAVCDTPWRGAKEHITAIELWEWMKKMQEEHGGRAWPRPWIIATGGEPTISPGFHSLVEHFAGVYPIAVETNGTYWTKDLERCDWIVVSPKVQYQPHGQNATVHPDVWRMAHEVRTVITFDSATPMLQDSAKNYLSPALEADGLGLEHLSPHPPRFVEGAVERCMEIILSDPRFMLSLQVHKWIGVR